MCFGSLLTSLPASVVSHLQSILYIALSLTLLKSSVHESLSTPSCLLARFAFTSMVFISPDSYHLTPNCLCTFSLCYLSSFIQPPWCSSVPVLQIQPFIAPPLLELTAFSLPGVGERKRLELSFFFKQQ